jgi:cytoskeletal protein CcmA (bactofilin family)
MGIFERDGGDALPEGVNGTSAFLGKGCKLTGKLTLEGPGRIEGQVEGEISAQGILIIGESAVVNAQVHGTSVTVQGRVTGDITASTRLELRAPSEVTGNISAPTLVIQEGASFQGQCTMSGQKGQKDKDRKVALFPTESPAVEAVPPPATARAK